MVTMTRCGTTDQRRFAALVPDDEPPDLVALVRLQILNTVLIADAAAGRDPAHIAYETMITQIRRRRLRRRMTLHRGVRAAGNLTGEQYLAGEYFQSR